jgi:hypothetical protein
MIVVGKTGEIELAGDVVIVRSKKGFLSAVREKRIPLSKIVGINFKPASLARGYLHFDTGSAFDDPLLGAISGDGGVLFDKKDEEAFIRLRDEVERRMG